MNKAVLLVILYAAGALAQEPAPVVRAYAPRYPAVALAEHISETIRVSVKIDATGKVTEADAISGINIDLRKASENAAKEWIFAKPPSATAEAILEFEYRVLKDQSNSDPDVFFEPPFKIVVQRHPLVSYGGDWTSSGTGH